MSIEIPYSFLIVPSIASFGLVAPIIFLFSKIAFSPSKTITNIGAIYLRLDQLINAEEKFKRAISIKPEFEIAHYNLGITQKKLNRLDYAKESFKKAISLGLSMNHDLAMAKLNLAGIAFTKRRKIEAQKLLTEAQKLDKRNILTEQIKIMKNQMKKTSIPNQHYGQNRVARRR